MFFTSWSILPTIYCMLFWISGDVSVSQHTLGKKSHQSITKLEKNIDKHIHTFLSSVAPCNDPPCLLNWES